MAAFIVLGCGYTGARVASRLAARGERVIATAREAGPGSVPGVPALRLDVRDPSPPAALAAATREPGARVLVTIPPFSVGGAIQDGTARALAAFGAAPARVVYLSTTGVYGLAEDVDERTPPSPADEAAAVRLAAERAAAGGPWSTLVLRSAAIYGPWRGLHAALQRGARPRVDDPDRVVSRVHVDDLAALLVAGLDADLTGAFPVADDEPATARELARLCGALGIGGGDLAAAPPGRGGWRGRRVHGAAIREALGVRLAHPSYRVGIPASLAAERARA